MQSKIQTRRFLLHTLIGLAGLNFCFGVAYYLSFNETFAMRNPNVTSSYRELLVIANLLYLLVDIFAGRARHEIKNFVYFSIGYFSLIVLLQAYEYSRVFHIYFAGLNFVFAFFSRYGNLTDLIEKNIWRNSRDEHLVLLIGDEFRQDLVEHIDTRPGSYRCSVFLSSKIKHEIFEEGILRAPISMLEEILKTSTIDEVLISTSSLPVASIDEILKTTEKYHSVTSILPPYFEYLAKQHYQTDYWLDVPITSVYHSKLAMTTNRVCKRLLDIAFSLFVLAVVFPVLCFVIIPAIWLSSRGPAFFKQKRKGYKQKPFLCYKFRTMMPQEASGEVVQAERADPRVTVFGRALRATSIDEIPQFLNVLRGQMSVVGPRPHMVEHDTMYEKFIERYNVRFAAKPGITGWAQINGLRGSTSNPDMMRRRIEHDLWYIKNWSFWLDLKIISLTTVRLFTGDRNAY